MSRLVLAMLCVGLLAGVGSNTARAGEVSNPQLCASLVQQLEFDRTHRVSAVVYEADKAAVQACLYDRRYDGGDDHSHKRLLIPS